jgi:hypothetical protein
LVNTFGILEFGIEIPYVCLPLDLQTPGYIPSGSP